MRYIFIYNLPSSIPSPTNQWTKALLEYIRSNLWLSLSQAVLIAVVLARQQTALLTSARSPPGTAVGGLLLMPIFWISYIKSNLTVWQYGLRMIQLLFGFHQFGLLQLKIIFINTFIPFTLNPVGHQSTKLTELFLLSRAIAELMSFGVTSPL